MHYSFSTEKLYVYWVRFFIRWHGLKHPRDMGASEVEGFLTMLATERKASATAHTWAQNALLFLYKLWPGSRDQRDKFPESCPIPT